MNDFHRFLYVKHWVWVYTSLIKMLWKIIGYSYFIHDWRHYQMEWTFDQDFTFFFHCCKNQGGCLPYQEKLIDGQLTTGVEFKTKSSAPHFPGCLISNSLANDILSLKGHPFTQALFTCLQFHIWKGDFKTSQELLWLRHGPFFLQ